jgi:hypothetical protein
MRKDLRLFLFLGLLFVCFQGIGVFAAGPQGVFSDKPLADINYGWRGIYFQPKISSGAFVLTVSRPDGSKFQRKFAAGSSPFYELLSTDIDGSYTYELRAFQEEGKRIRDGIDKVEDSERQAGFLQTGSPYRNKMTQTGYFRVQGQRIGPSGASEGELAGSQDTVSIQDQFISDDLIVDGCLSVGTDSYDGYAFGLDTIVLMESNLRIFFDDTSTASNYPSNDWRIIANDSADGGGEYFSIEDATEVSKIFTLEAGAPENSLYVDSHGDVGINTSTPYYELHIVDGDSPCVRLDQDGSYGWEPQKWDLCGNESNFFIRDATHASKLPFRIEPEAPTDTIFLKSNGNVGIGTGSPGYAMELERTGTNAAFILDRTDGAKNYINATSGFGNFGTVNNYPLRLVVNGLWKMRLNSDGSLEMSNGATCTVGGEWQNSSSRELKENIRGLTAGEAMEALEGLEPVRFNYKADEKNECIGFIAEDVPEIVATKDRKTMSSMDVVAVLTKVVQEQQKSVEEQQKIVKKQQETIDELRKRVAELERQLP